MRKNKKLEKFIADVSKGDTLLYTLITAVEKYTKPPVVLQNQH